MNRVFLSLATLTASGQTFDVDEFLSECDETYTGIGEDYRGCQSVSKTGKKCQQWGYQFPVSNSYFPHSYPDSGLSMHNTLDGTTHGWDPNNGISNNGLGHSYCRNPSGNSGGLWCYVECPTYRTLGACMRGDARWEYCNAAEVTLSQAEIVALASTITTLTTAKNNAVVDLATCNDDLEHAEEELQTAEGSLSGAMCLLGNTYQLANRFGVNCDDQWNKWSCEEALEECHDDYDVLLNVLAQFQE